jgi:hypothetical protein
MCYASVLCFALRLVLLRAKRQHRIRTADSKLEVCSLAALAAKLDL